MVTKKVYVNKKALYAGTFDPFTNGHLDIVHRGLQIFDEITLLLAVSPSKTPFLSKDKRLSLLQDLFKDEPRVKIDSWSGLVVDYAKEHKISSIIRGLRPTGDFESEFQMASMNRKLNVEADTVFLMTGENLYYVSSSLVKEVFNHGGNISEFVPKIIYQELLKQKK